MSNENGLMRGFKGSVGMAGWEVISGREADSAVCKREISKGMSLFLDDGLPKR